MKTTIRNSAFMGLALFAALSIATITKANDHKKDSTIPGIEFKYIGKVENRPMFQLKLVNSDADQYLIRFRDNSGYVFYANTITGNFSQRFIVNVDELDGNTITVEVKSKNSRKAQTFTIQRNQRLIDETVVAKID